MIVNNNKQQLALKLYQVALNSLSEANKGNPFISKRDAMKDINMSRKLLYK